MCRLFGFRSVLQSQVHRSLANADNALAVQSLAGGDAAAERTAKATEQTARNTKRLADAAQP